MLDELERLQEMFLRDDDVEPDQRSWEHLRTQLALAMDAERQPSLPPHRKRSLYIGGIATAITAVAAAIFALALFVVPEQKGTQGTAVLDPKPSMSWLLVGAIKGKPPLDPNKGAMSLECPTARTCYASGAASNAPDAGVDSTVTHDGGSVWAPVVLPGSATLESDFTCPAPSSCMVVSFAAPTGFSMLTTDTSGTTWTERSTPVPEGAEVKELLCFTEKSCYIFAIVPDGKDHTSETALMRTVNGGTTWTTQLLPWSASSVSCSSESSCTGLQSNRPTIAWSTSDGGRTWSRRSLSDVFGAQSIESLTCPSGGVCLATTGTAVYISTDSGTTWSGSSLLAAATGPTSIDCATQTICYVTAWSGSLSRYLVYSDAPVAN